jgi:hypothetical protein
MSIHHAIRYSVHITFAALHFNHTSFWHFGLNVNLNCSGIEFELASTDVNANGFAELFRQALAMLYVGKHLALAVIQQVDVVGTTWRRAIL